MKEPWQMTREEHYDWALDRLTQRRERRGRKVFVTEDEEARFKITAHTNHVMAVRKAVEARKPVPENVLAQYPDMEGFAKVLDSWGGRGKRA